MAIGKVGFFPVRKASHTFFDGAADDGIRSLAPQRRDSSHAGADVDVGVVLLSRPDGVDDAVLRGRSVEGEVALARFVGARLGGAAEDRREEVEVEVFLVVGDMVVDDVEFLSDWES